MISLILRSGSPKLQNFTNDGMVHDSRKPFTVCPHGAAGYMLHVDWWLFMNVFHGYFVGGYF